MRRSIGGVLFIGSMLLLLAGCAANRQLSTTGTGEGSRRGKAPVIVPGATPANTPALPAAGSGRGGYYQDDGPGEAPPPDLQAIPDAQPKIEPYGRRGNRPYVVFGKSYTPITDDRPLKQRGIGSWYGRKFHGQKTSSGELYDMYKMTAAHPTLPLPSYARVTNIATGTQVIVRVNDRGPFHSGRIIDLSYTAALKLGYLRHGSSELEVERLLPEDIARFNSSQPGVAQAAASAPMPDPAPNAPLNSPLNSYLSPVPLSPPVPVSNILSLDDFFESQQVKETQPATRIAADAGTTVPDLAALPTLAGFYLQFGAFSQEVNAETMRARLMQAWPPLVPPPVIKQHDAIYRLYSGPFDTRADALRAAAMLEANPLARPLIVRP